LPIDLSTTPKLVVLKHRTSSMITKSCTIMQITSDRCSADRDILFVVILLCVGLQRWFGPFLSIWWFGLFFLIILLSQIFCFKSFKESDASWRSTWYLFWKGGSFLYLNIKYIWSSMLSLIRWADWVMVRVFTINQYR